MKMISSVNFDEKYYAIPNCDERSILLSTIIVFVRNILLPSNTTFCMAMDGNQFCEEKMMIGEKQL